MLALLSWSTWGPVSIATLCLAWVAAVAAPVAGLIARARAEKTKKRARRKDKRRARRKDKERQKSARVEKSNSEAERKVNKQPRLSNQPNLQSK